MLKRAEIGAAVGKPALRGARVGIYVGRKATSAKALRPLIGNSSTRLFSITWPMVASSRIHQRHLGGHLHGFAHRADLELRVDFGMLIDLKADAGPDPFLKPVLLDGDFVVADNQRRRGVVAFGIGLSGDGGVGLRIDD